MELLIGAVIGMLVTVVAVCAAEPNYRNIVEQETIEKIEKTLPTEISMHIKDTSGVEWDFTMPVNLLKLRRSK